MIKKVSKMSRGGPPQLAVQRQIQEDWANREYIEVITTNIKKIADFLNSFGKLNPQITHAFIHVISMFLLVLLRIQHVIIQ